MTAPRVQRALAAAAGPLLAACEGPQRVFAPAGPGASELGRLGVFLIVATVIPALVAIAFALVAVLRRRRSPPAGAEEERREHRIVMLAGGLGPALLISVLAVASIWVGRRVVAPPGEPEVEIEVVGHQFWWEVRYPEEGIVTANEIHVPVGAVARLRVTSADVIHSLWVPELQGKIDMMPGRVHTTWLRADAPGEYRGQCAEFCGVQHALMAFVVRAVEPEEFERFVAREREGRTAPQGGLHARGARVFAEARCDACHAVRGVHEPRGVGSPGPDLTHLATRRTLAAGTAPLTEDSVASFIRNPAVLKPGVRMPATDLEPEDLRALVSWLLAGGGEP